MLAIARCPSRRPPCWLSHRPLSTAPRLPIHATHEVAPCGVRLGPDIRFESAKCSGARLGSRRRALSPGSRRRPVLPLARRPRHLDRALTYHLQHRYPSASRPRLSTTLQPSPATARTDHRHSNRNNNPAAPLRYAAHSITYDDVIPASRFTRYHLPVARSRRQRRAGSQRPRAQTSTRPRQAEREVGDTLAALRRTVGLTQVQLAAKLGASQRAISHVEHEPNPRVATLDGYVQALGGRLELRVVLEDRSVVLLLASDA